MAKYVKKAVIVNAEKYVAGMEDGFACIAVSEFEICDEKCRNAIRRDKGLYCLFSRPYIETLEGNIFILIDDWIITGVDGERYPIKPDIFKKTYRRV